MLTDALPTPSRFMDASQSGLRVFPVILRDKKPALPWKQFVDQEPTTNQLADWDAGDYNLGVITGTPSGIVVLDVDSPDAQTFVEGLNLPLTPAVSTGRGTHYYFKLPAGGVRNTTKIGGHKLDLRGDGGYVVGHGSIHETGRRYEWLVSPDEVPFAEFPEQLHLFGSTSRPGSR